VVGINSWVAHANEDVFGPDAALFRPERWLEEPEVVRKRESYFLAVRLVRLRSRMYANTSRLSLAKALGRVLARTLA